MGSIVNPPAQLIVEIPTEHAIPAEPSTIPEVQSDIVASHSAPSPLLVSLIYAHPVVSFPGSFPTEIEESIIGELQDDVEALRSCALVCHAWHPRSVVHLFTGIRLTPNATQLDNLRTYLDELPFLISKVSSMTIEFADQLNILRPLGGLRLPHLRSLKLGFCYMETLPPVCFHPHTLRALRTTSQLEYLHLYGVRFDKAIHLTKLIEALPCLRTLRCQTVELPSPEPQVVPPGPVIVQMRLGQSNLKSLTVSIFHAM